MIQAMTLNEIKDQIVLTARTTMPTVTVQTGFVKQQFFGSLSHPIALVSLKNLTAEQGGFYGVQTAEHTAFEQSGAMANATFCLSLYLSSDDTLDAVSLLQTICVGLATNETTDFYQFQISELTYNQTLQCFCVQLEASCRLLLMAEKQTVSIQSVVVEVEQKEELHEFY